MTLALKELHVKTYPSLLIVHLNRFKNLDGKKIKNSDPIQYNAV
jgi:ubiquitin C-terminal hydrolase